MKFGTEKRSLPDKKITKFRSIRPLLNDMGIVLSLLAREGHDTQDEIIHAFNQGATVITPKSPTFLSAKESSLNSFSFSVKTIAIPNFNTGSKISIHRQRQKFTFLLKSESTTKNHNLVQTNLAMLNSLKGPVGWNFLTMR